MNTEMLVTYKDLKSKMDAAYTVFKKDPSYQNVSRHNAAVQAFTTFCVNAMAELVGEEPADNRNQILENIEDYRTCKKCESEILFQTDEKHYIASSDFVPEFPGWCYTCLVEHCLKTNCEECKVASDPAACSFKDVKTFYQESDI